MTFILKINVFHNKNLVRRVTLSYNFANVMCNVWLRGQMNSHIYSCIQYIMICLSGKNEESPSSHRYVIGKGMGILIDFQIIMIFFDTMPKLNK